MKRFVIEYIKGDSDPNDPNKNGDSKVAGKDNPEVPAPVSVGDRVYVKGNSSFHPWHRGKMATVKEIGGSTNAVQFDDDSDRIQYWFFDGEMKPLNEKPSEASKGKFKPGDRVHIKGDSQFHPNHQGKVGTIKEVGKACVALAFDDNPDHTQRWFVQDDLTKVDACADK